MEVVSLLSSFGKEKERGYRRFETPGRRSKVLSHLGPHGGGLVALLSLVLESLLHLQRTATTVATVN